MPVVKRRSMDRMVNNSVSDSESMNNNLPQEKPAETIPLLPPSHKQTSSDDESVSSISQSTTVTFDHHTNSRTFLNNLPRRRFRRGVQLISSNMIVRFLRQLLLLCHKNLIVQLRAPFWTIFEIMPPIIVVVTFVLLRSQFPDTVQDARVFDDHLPPRLWPAYRPLRDTQLLCPLQKSMSPPNVLMFAPDSTQNRAVMYSVKQALDVTDQKISFQIQGFKTETELVKAAENSLRMLNSTFGESCPNEPRVYAGVVFAFNDVADTKQLKYSIRLPNIWAPNTFNPFNTEYCTCQPPGDGYATEKRFPSDKWQSPGPRSTYGFENETPYSVYNYNSGGGSTISGWDYFTVGFTMLQHAVDRAIIKELALVHSKPVNVLELVKVNIQRMPHPSYTQTNFINSNVSVILLSLLMTIALISSGLYAAKTVLAEKESHTKEYMLTMGLSNTCWWLSHFVFAFVKQLLVMVVSSLLLCYWAPYNNQRALPLTNCGLLLLLLLLWSICIILMAYSAVSILNKASRVTTFILIFWLLSLIPSFIVSLDSDSVFTLCLACLLLNSAMSIGLEVVMKLEMQSFSLGWLSVGRGVTPNTNFSFAHVLCMLLVQMVLYWIVIALADENSHLRRLITFATHRVGRSRARSGHRDKYLVIEGSDSPAPGAQTQAGAVPNRRTSSTIRRSRVEDHHDAAAKPSIQINNLRKTFQTGLFGMERFTAVDKLTFDVLPNQLTVLLGHNGAGKSTTFAMLTGSLKPSEGSAEIAGYNLFTDFNKIHERMGFCPQHNVLFNELTVIDHLKFFCRLKNRAVDNAEIDELLVLLSLSEKRNCKAGTLSGGQKRKLSVGIALVGRSEIVLLDEPSSGVDAQTRHEFWKLLQQEKTRRTILMTTHYMEEADVLGDRIVIMTNGKLHCAGTSMFLKRKYGAGYHLVVDYNRDRVEKDVTDTLQLLQTQCAAHHIQLETVTGTQATFLLPYEARSMFATCLNELSAQQETLHITSFGVSVTTLEEVFLKVGQEARSKQHAELDTGSTIADLTVPERLTGWALYFSQIRGLLYKRAHCWLQGGFSASIMMCIYLLLLSVLLAFTYASDVTSRVAVQAESALSLTPDLFKQPVIKTFYTNDTNQALWKAYAASTAKYAGSSQLETVGDQSDMVSKASAVYLAQYKTLDWSHAYEQVVVGAAFMGKSDTPTVQAWYSGEPYHALPVSLGVIDQSLLHLVMEDASYSLVCVNHPLQAIDLRFKSGTDIFQNLSNIVAVIINGMVMPLAALVLLVLVISDYTARYTTVIAEERQSGMRHLQYAAGVSPVVYWGTHFLFDYGVLLLPALAIYILFAVFDFNGFFVGSTSLCYWLLFVLFGWAQIPSRYLLTYVIKRPSRAMIASTVISLLTGVMYLSVAYSFHISILVPEVTPVSDASPSALPDWLYSTERTLRLIGSILSPMFNFAYCLFEMYLLGSMRYGCAEYAGKTIDPATFKMPKSIWELTGIMSCSKEDAIRPILRANTDPFLGWNEFWWSAGVGFQLLMLFAQGCVYWIILLVIDHRLFDRLFPKHNTLQPTVSPDPDIGAEQTRVQQTDPSQLMIAANSLSKTFGNFRAVQNVSFGVSSGECFGLLGVNGAGKTTTFKMLTGELPIKDGTVHLNGCSVNHNWQQACTVAGYCPQFEAVLQRLTGKQLLRLFARLRGIPEPNVAEVTRNVLHAVDITRYRNRPFAKYSGGTKRRCSLGLALIGVPGALMLDEPTTGVDPVARRALWDILRQLKDSDLHKVAILLTSHSMEECDALCDRLSIMIQGQFSCLGSPQYLKSRFGTAFTLNVRLRDDQQFDAVNHAIQSSFLGAICTQRHHTSLSYSVPLANGQEHSWASLFAVMERVSEDQGLDDYNLSQATLEDVFLAFSTHKLVPVVSVAVPPNQIAVNPNYAQPLSPPAVTPNQVQMQML